MTRKAWVFHTSDDKIVDAVTARKKIAYIDEYICDLYAQMFGGDHTDLKSLVIHPSGTEVFLEKDGHSLRAQLAQIDDHVWAQFAKSDNTDW